jgi:TolB-like protein
LLADLKDHFGERFEELLVVERERVALGLDVRTDLTDPTLARPKGEPFEGLDHIDPVLDEWLRVERERWATYMAARPPGAERTAAARRTGRRGWQRIAALLVLVATVSALFYFRPWAIPKQPVIAVLKFKDVTGQNAFLADGLAEQLRIELAQYPSIAVIGRASSEAEQIKAADSRALARLLSATHLLEGSIVRHDGALEVALRLIDGKSGRSVWNSVAGASRPDIVSGTLRAIPAMAEHVSEVSRKGVPSFAMRADAES